MELLKCVLYIAAIGMVSNLVGTALPRSWFNPERFPYRTFSWEQGGKVYEKLGIREWKDKLPDMSKFMQNMYRKEVNIRPNAENLDRLIQETCVAELIHDILIVLSLGVVKIWRGNWGWFLWGLCLLGNVPFILIQRFNRPRLQKTLRRLTAGRRAVPADHAYTGGL